MSVINKLENYLFIYRIVIGENKYGNNIYGFVPTRKPIGEKKVFIRQAENYYRKKDKELSYEAYHIKNNVKRSSVNPPDINGVIEKIYTRKKPSLTYMNYKFFYRWMLKEISDLSNDPYVVEDVFGQRIHTIFTIMPSELRRHARIDNRKTIELDLSQSQPSFFAQLLFDEIGKNSFTSAINSGDIYDIIAKKHGLTSRASAKKEFYKTLFGPIYMSEEFFSMFPDTKLWIKKVKSTYYENNPNSLKYTNLSMILQRYESTIMKKVWRELIENEIIFLTVHDSIIVKRKDFRKSNKIMKEVLKNTLTNVNVKINTKTTAN